MDDKDEKKRLVFENLADKEQPSKTFTLDKNETFLSFVDHCLYKHEASVTVLLHHRGKGGDMISTKTYNYIEPFSKKDFSDDDHWVVDA